VSVIERSKQKPIFVSALGQMDRRGVPEWLELEKENLSGSIKTLPTREGITLPIQEQLIVEYYSR
jgi:small subunit ribosomal protein S4